MWIYIGTFVILVIMALYGHIVFHTGVEAGKGRHPAFIICGLLLMLISVIFLVILVGKCLT